MSDRESPQPADPESVPPTDPESPQRIAAWWWAAGAAVLVAVLIVAVALTRPDASDGVAAGTETISPSISASKSSLPDPSVSSAAPVESPDAGSSDAPNPDQPSPTQTVPVDGEGTPSPGVTASVSSIEAVDGTAELPGEVGGPSLRVSVEVTNGTDAPLDLTFAVVNLYYGADSTPATPLGQPGVQPFPASVAAGKSGTGTFVFNVPVSVRDDIQIELDLSVDSTIVVFRGAAGV